MFLVRQDHPTSGRILTRCLEIQAAEHCNVRCEGCAQNSPFLPRRFPNLEDLDTDLCRLGIVFHTERVSVVGGEPLLNSEIVSLLALLRRRQIADQLVVTTNGLLLGRMPSAFWEQVDAVEISLYPSIKDEVLRAVQSVLPHAWSTRTEIRLLPTPAFKRITLTEPLDDATRAESFGRCYFKEFTHTLRDGKIYRCAPATNIPAKIRRANAGLGVPEDAGFDMAGASDLRRELFEYLTSTAPLEACRFCLGSSGIESEHRMLTREEAATPARISYAPGMLVPQQE